jgi:protein gp37
MSAKTKIEWADKTWNPVRGCALVSEGCRNCYAMRTAHRFSGPGKPYEGLTEMGPNGPRWTGHARVIYEAMDEPLRWRESQRIFVNSMSDLFHDDVDIDDIAHIFAVMALAHWHQFQILTKRPTRMQQVVGSLDFRERVDSWMSMMLDDEERPPSLAWDAEARLTTDARATAPDVTSDDAWPLPNVWLGVSVEHQQAANERISHLLLTPAAVRFLSCEPLLGPIDLEHIPAGPLCPQQPEHRVDVLRGGTWNLRSGFVPKGQPDFINHSDMERIDWVIGGGESQYGARPMHPDWIRSLRDQCVAAGRPFLFKQWGEWTPGENVERQTGWVRGATWLDDRWFFTDEDLSNEEAHIDDEPDLYRVGKEEAGRHLDGVVWDQFPVAQRETATTR